MKDLILNKFDKCPECGKADSLFYTKEQTITSFISLSGKLFTFNEKGNRKYTFTSKDKALLYDIIEDDDPVYICHCEYCKWYSEPFDKDGISMLV